MCHIISIENEIFDKSTIRILLLLLMLILLILHREDQMRTCIQWLVQVIELSTIMIIIAMFTVVTVSVHLHDLDHLLLQYYANTAPLFKVNTQIPQSEVWSIWSCYVRILHTLDLKTLKLSLLILLTLWHLITEMIEYDTKYVRNHLFRLFLTRNFGSLLDFSLQ